MGDEESADDHGGERSATRLLHVAYRPSRRTFQVGTNPLSLLQELAGIGRLIPIGRLDALAEPQTFDPEECYLAWDLVLATEQPRRSVEDVFMFVDAESVVEITELAPDAARALAATAVERGVVQAGTVEELIASAAAESRGAGDARQPTDEDRSAGASRTVDSSHADPRAEAAGSSSDASAGGPAPASSKPSKEHGAGGNASGTDAPSGAGTDAPSGAAAPGATGAGGGTIKVRVDRLDRLVNLVGEMVSLQAQISLQAGRLGDRTMAGHSEQLERLVREARELSMELHMVPVEALFAPFRRHVRSLAGELGREVTLEMSGTETELDKNVVEALRDPLLHIVRNAIDHGIEPPDRREAAGKPRSGTLRLSAGYTGALVRLTISDDGAGLNADRIRARAIERGVISAQDSWSDEKAYDLIFAPGFSTTAEATSVSGRGVGMDVVRRNVENLSGAVTVSSTPGSGTTVELRIPLTLAIVEGLLSEVAGQYVLINLAYVRECIDGSRLERRSAEDFFNFRGSVVPTIDLARFFGIGEASMTDPVIVVEAGEQVVGLVVARLHGNHQSVVKSLGKMLRAVDGVSGAVFLSDGTPALMLDVERIVSRATMRWANHGQGREA